jgi:hypothetical protein
MPQESDFPAHITKRVTARKYQGDDRSSWAVFIDGHPFVTGLTRPEVAYYRRRAYEQLWTPTKTRSAA